MELLVELRHENEEVWAYYSNFQVDDQATGYKLTIGGYDSSSPAGDALAINDGMEWSAPDLDRDKSGRNCASLLSSGWWYNACTRSNPLGVYGAEGAVNSNSWTPWLGNQTPLD